MQTRHTDWATRVSYGPLCLGFALYFSAFPLASIGTITLAHFAQDWQTVLWARVIFLVMGVFAIWQTVRARQTSWLAIHRTAVCAVACLLPSPRCSLAEHPPLSYGISGAMQPFLDSTWEGS